MFVTTKHIEQRYMELNGKIFQGELPSDVRFHLHDSFTLLGQYNCRVNARQQVVSHSISISRNYDWDEDVLDDIIIHEMIHEYIYYFGIKIGRNTHGPVFLKLMDDINMKHGRNIAVKPPLGIMKPMPGTSKLRWWIARNFAI